MWKRSLLLLAISVVVVTIDGRRRGGSGRGKKDSAEAATTASQTSRQERFLSLFQVVRFQNDICDGGSERNGTCYTAAECQDRGGSSAGSCAQGFGVCCTFVLGCGQTSSENCTYLVYPSSNGDPLDASCAYTICKTSPNICRIRLDFMTFNIAQPFVGTAAIDAAYEDTVSGAIGDCTTDSFAFTSPGNVGSPVICGFNSGQHMIVDASDECNQAVFGIGGTGTGNSRQWDIKVTQFTCGDQSAGPDGCLQYFTGTSGRISSFNFPTTSTEIGATTTHLSNQCYTICIRREAGRCGICYVTSITGVQDDAGDQGSFGLSVSPDNTAAKSDQGTPCVADYLRIPSPEFPIGPPGSAPSVDTGNLCGRVFSVTTNDDTLGQTVCSRASPFRLTFKTDADEVSDATAAADEEADVEEQSEAPGGIIGFSLDYQQQPC